MVHWLIVYWLIIYRLIVYRLISLLVKGLPAGKSTGQ